MKRPSSPRGRLLCTSLLIVVVLTLFGHVWAESLIDVSPADDTRHRGPAKAPEAAHAALCAATLSGAQSGCPTPSHAEVAFLGPAPTLVAKPAARPSQAGSVPSARSGDGSPPLFLLHATFLI